MPIVLALVSSVLYGSADFLGGLASRRAPVIAVTALSQGAGLLLLVLALPLAPGHLGAADLWWGLGAGLSGSLGVVLLYAALARGPVSTAAPLVSLVAIAIPVLAGIASGERPGPWPLAGIALGIGAVVLLSRVSAPPPPRDRSAPASRGILGFALASGVLVGGFLVCVGRIGAGAGLMPLVLARASGTLTLVIVMFVTRTPARAAWVAWPAVAGCGAADVAANLLYLLAVQRAPLSLVATIVSLAPASTIVLAQWFLHERLGRMQLAGVALALVSVALLAGGLAH